MRTLLFILFVTGLAACRGASAEDPGATVQIRGVYVQPVYEGRAALIDHEAIFGRMPAMRMSFKLYTPALLDSLSPGDKVRITLDSLTLTTILDIQQISPETMLDLSDGGSNHGGVLLPEIEEL